MIIAHIYKKNNFNRNPHARNTTKIVHKKQSRVQTHLVNHQKVMVERKPAVASGQGFWEGNKEKARGEGRLNKDKESPWLWPVWLCMPLCAH